MVLTPAVVEAQAVLMTGVGSYSQNFDTLASVGTIVPAPTSGPAVPWVDNTNIAGWYAAQAITTLTNLSIGNGSSTIGQLYSFGDPSATERALGSLSSGTPGAFAYGVLFQNTSGVPLVIDSLSFTGEQWRNGGSGTAHKLEFSYQTSSTAITSPNPTSLLPAGWTAFASGNFTGPIATGSSAILDGNAAANKLAIAATPSIVVPAGHYAFLRWYDSNDTGSDHGLALDDLTVSWSAAANPLIGLTALATNFSENAGNGATTGVVSIPTALAADLTVNLTSSDITEATVPASVTILQGTTSIPYTINAVNDFIVDGNQAVSITASAPGYLSAVVNLAVADDNDAPIAVTITPETFAENAGSAIASGSVTVVENVVADLTVTLTSSLITEATISSSSVTITAGTNTAAFTVNAVDDQIIDGTRTVNITATAPGYTTGSKQITVTDFGDSAPLPTLPINAIAFTGYNADGNDNLAFVVLTDIAPGDVILFSDNEWNGGPPGGGGGFSDTNEGLLTWTAPAGGVAAGTIVTLDDVSIPGRTSSVGTLTGSNFVLAAGGDTVYAFQGALLQPTRVLAAISAADPLVEVITNTGLTDYVLLPLGTDIGAYKGLRNDQTTFSSYLTSIHNEAANWVTQDNSGNDGIDSVAPDVPFSNIPFTLSTPSNNFSSWAQANTGSSSASTTGDHDNDGVSNGVEFFMGQTGSTFTPNPVPDANRLLSFPVSATATGVTGIIQTSPDLVTWTTLASTTAGGFITATIPAPDAGVKIFARLNVVVTP
jgi:hypothetical protein